MKYTVCHGISTITSNFNADTPEDAAKAFAVSKLANYSEPHQIVKVAWIENGEICLKTYRLTPPSKPEWKVERFY